MAPDTDVRQHAHELLDQLGPGQLEAVVHLLETMVSPEDDLDTISPAERAAVAEAEEWLTHNEPIANEESLTEFGLSAGDWEMGEAPASEKTPS